MKKCLLGIAMLFMAGFSFAQEVSTSEYWTATPASATIAANGTQEFVMSINVSEENVENLMSGYFAIVLPEGMEFVKAYGGKVKNYYAFVPGSSFAEYECGFNITQNGKYPNVLVVAFTCYYADDPVPLLDEDGNAQFDENGDTIKYQPTYGFPFEKVEDEFKFTVKGTDKMQTGDIKVVVGDKPFLDGFPGEDPKIQLVTLDNDIIYINETEIPITYAPTFNVGESGYATLSWPVALDFSGADYKASIVTGLENGYAQREYVDKVPANTGVIIEAAAGDYPIKTTADEVEAPETNLLVGTATKAYTATTNTYALAKKDAGVGFYRCQEGVSIPKYKAYIEVAASADEAFLFEETTGISNINAEAAVNDAYTISGVKVNNPTQKGVYIVNGKKVVVK